MSHISLEPSMVVRNEQRRFRHQLDRRTPEDGGVRMRTHSHPLRLRQQQTISP